MHSMAAIGEVKQKVKFWKWFKSLFSLFWEFNIHNTNYKQIWMASTIIWSDAQLAYLWLEPMHTE